MLIKLLFL